MNEDSVKSSSSGKDLKKELFNFSNKFKIV